MAKLFLDANCLIDLIENRDETLAQQLTGHQLVISALSIHILCYVGKHTMPSNLLDQALSYFTTVSMNQEIATKSLQGPTPDFEDNVQLHSALFSQCEYFVSRDTKLLQNSACHLAPVIDPAQLQNL
ncbi:MAG TPA: hypothetical protein PKJ26_00830 [Candidatus Woesebacteria bacterium]|nr:hypothetical protein [Candidatus Woesebacteria bacterium]HNS65020.1 hypothetical protein [Candidatus Woesebacteria bacterium]